MITLARSTRSPLLLAGLAIALLLSLLAVSAPPAGAAVNCSTWTQPSRSVGKFDAGIAGNNWIVRRGPSGEKACDRGVRYNNNEIVTVHGIDSTGAWAYVYNSRRGDWGWISYGSLDVTRANNSAVSEALSTSSRKQ